MNNSSREILVFKTNLASEEEVKTVTPLLSGHPDILQWNVDKWDADNILRIESSKLSPDIVINILSEAGFECEELED